MSKVSFSVAAHTKMNNPLKTVLRRNTAWMFVGQGLRLVIQALYFVEIARSLGSSNYGAFVGVVALIGILFPYGTLGSGNLLVKNVSRDKRLFGNCWGLSLITTAVISSVLLTIAMLFSHFVLPVEIPRRLVLLVGASDLFGMNVIGVCGQAFQAFERLNWTAGINVMISASRLTGALVMIEIHPHPSALQWGYLYFWSTAVIAIGASILVCAKLGPPRFTIIRTPAELREGLYFSVGISSQTIYNDLDKTMLARLGSLEAAGIYGAAYRLIDVSFAPVSALLAAAYPTFFRTGAAGLSGSLTPAKRLLPRAVAYAVMVGVALLLGAGVVPRILGPEYNRTAEALRWLAILPTLKAFHYLLSDALSGAGYQGLRASIQAGVAVFNVLINLWLIPAYSWRGAAWSSIASDGLLVCGIGAAVWWLSRPPAGMLVHANSPS